MKKIIAILFLAGLLLNGLLGFGTSLTFLWPGYLALGVAAIASAFLPARTGGSGEGPRPVAWCLAAAFLLAAFVAVRARLSPVAYFAREDMSLLGAWFITYILAAVVLSHPRRKRWMAVALAGLAVINIGLAFWQFTRDPSLWIVPGYARTYLDRSGGVFNNPNHLAGFLAAVTPLFISLAALGRMSPHSRLLLAFLSVLSLITLSLTKSRGGILAMAAGLLVVAIVLIWTFRGVWRRKTAIAVAGLVMGAVTVAGLGALHFDILGKRFGASAFSTAAEANRPLLWASALEQNALSPLFGTGSRSFTYYSRKFRPPEMHVSVQEAGFAHNEYLQMAADYGWIGLALAMGFCLVHVWNGLRFFRGQDPARESGAAASPSDRLAGTTGALAGLAALGVHASVDFLLHVPAIAATAAILLGFLANPGFPEPRREASARNSPQSRFAIAGRIAAVATGAALVYFGATFLRSEWHYERARLAYTGDQDISLFGHLRRSRELDPLNPFAHSLSGHAHLHALDPAMPPPVMNAYLQKALRHFESAVNLYPADVYAMIGLASCMDATGQHKEAEAVLSRAREWAPLYGNVMHAQATHFYRLGNLDQAEVFYHQAEASAAFRDWQSASRALDRIKRDRQKASRPPGQNIADTEEIGE